MEERIEELRGVVRTGYVSICSDRQDELERSIIHLQDEPPNTPFYRVNISVIETEPRYREQRATDGMGGVDGYRLSM